MFEIRMGVPEMKGFWDDLSKKVSDNTATKNEIRQYKKLKKALKLLADNPYHNSLCSHEIDVLTKRYGMKVWQSYLENKKPKAGRLFWIYYPPGSITIIGLEPHPDDNQHSYNKITLSSTK